MRFPFLEAWYPYYYCSRGTGTPWKQACLGGTPGSRRASSGPEGRSRGRRARSQKNGRIISFVTRAPQSDPDHHLHVSVFNAVPGSLGRGTYTVPFYHSSPRITCLPRPRAWRTCTPSSSGGLWRGPVAPTAAPRSPSLVSSLCHVFAPTVNAAGPSRNPRPDAQTASSTDGRTMPANKCFSQRKRRSRRTSSRAWNSSRASPST